MHLAGVDRARQGGLREKVDVGCAQIGRGRQMNFFLESLRLASSHFWSNNRE